MLEGIAQWIMGICGVAVLGVLLDVILPEGKMQKYIRSIFALAMTLVILTPLPNLLNSVYNPELPSLGSESNIVSKYRELEDAAEAALKKQQVDAVVTIAFDGENIKFANVSVYGKTEIGKEKIAETVAKTLNISKEAVFVYVGS